MPPRAVRLAVLVAALGYFVDIYYLLLFGIVRRPSLIDLGVAKEHLLDRGVFLDNMQMGAMPLRGVCVHGLRHRLLGGVRDDGLRQFGTNLRATATTTAPNIVRGSTVILTLSFSSLSRTSLGAWGAALAVGVPCVALAYVALFSLEETYGKNLDFVE